MILKKIMESEQTRPLLDKALSTYPIYKPTNESLYYLIPTREELNNKILGFYKYRDIGFETIGRFLEELELSMNEIMPYYNQLYKSCDILNGIEDVFGNVDITETYEEEREDSSKGSSSNNLKDRSSNSSEGTSEGRTDSEASDRTNTHGEVENYNKQVKSSTPQSQLNISNKGINELTYADEISWNHDSNSENGSSEGSSSSTSENTSKVTSEGSSESTSEGSSESSSESLGTTRHTLNKKGNHGVNTYAHDMKELRELFINIEQQIINDKRIAELFMLVY